jgi:hypothetical protein
MGSRSGKRGDDPASYSDEELRLEIERVRTNMRVFPNLRSSLRKSRASRVHNLEKELSQRGADRD